MNETIILKFVFKIVYLHVDAFLPDSSPNGANDFHKLFLGPVKIFKRCYTDLILNFGTKLHYGLSLIRTPSISCKITQCNW